MRLIGVALAGVAALTFLAPVPSFAVGWQSAQPLPSAPSTAGFEEDKPWVELDPELPASPKEENWHAFYVSETTDNRFYVDTASLSIGDDGVVRYTLLTLSREGVRNVAYYGMRCQSKEVKIYASGRRDGSWFKARRSAWEKIREGAPNRFQAALFTDVFCPGGAIVRNVGEALQALRKGGHEPVWRNW